jgi:hypothetical protein
MPEFLKHLQGSQGDDLILPSPKLYWDLKALPTFDFFPGFA